MNRITKSIALLALSASVCARGQGTMVYDQQSSTTEGNYVGIFSIQFHMPVQSFTPNFSGVDFVRLALNDNNSFSGTGATVYVNLRSDAFDGPIVASTEPVFMANGFTGFTNFIFSSSVSLTPGASYFFEPKELSGDPDWRIVAGELGYPGGQAYNQGVPTAVDLWFREGIIVPEPSAIALIPLGCCLWVAIRRMR